VINAERGSRNAICRNYDWILMASLEIGAVKGVFINAK
jgi:hypothetical protein